MPRSSLAKQEELADHAWERTKDAYNSLTIWGSESIEITSREQAEREMEMLRRLVQWEAVNGLEYCIGESPDDLPEDERYSGLVTGGGISLKALSPSTDPDRPTFYDRVMGALEDGERVSYSVSLDKVLRYSLD